MKTVDRAKFIEWYERTQITGQDETEEDRLMNSAYVALGFGQPVALTVDGQKVGQMSMNYDGVIHETKTRF